MPDLPPIPSDVEKATKEGDLILLPPARYLALVNWIQAAKAVPGQCRAIVASEKDHARASLAASVARCESAQRLAVAEASRIDGIHPLAVTAIAIGALVVGVASGVLTVLVIR